MKKRAEYLWLDGATPTQKMRSKTRIIEIEDPAGVTLDDFPIWNFDGSSTYQADGHDSDLTLKPVCHVPDPIRGDGNFLVMCEVRNGDGLPHPTNHRAALVDVLGQIGEEHEPWFGFEQEYTLFRGRNPLGWPADGYPAPQGPFYCGVGADEVFGRPLIEAHTKACLDAGLMLYGINAEVMPGQWEFQLGHRGFQDEVGAAPLVADQLWIARWLLYRLGEEYGVSATLHCKPVRGDWNGAGCHTNFSTRAMRSPKTGKRAIQEAVRRLEANHHEHIAHYGAGLEDRLTGLHETCPIDQFRHGVADRGASIRIPRSVSEKGYGYIEDRRPGANCNPYIVCTKLLQTVCRAGQLAAVV